MHAESSFTLNVPTAASKSRFLSHPFYAPFTHDNGDPIANSLFDYVEDEQQNQYKRAVALCLDRNADVLWWYRNLVGSDQFAIQGYRKDRIHPDFIVQSGKNHKRLHRVIVIESKGKHLEGNLNTEYKREVATYFEKAGKKVTWQQLGEDFKDHVFRFQILDKAQEHRRDWKDELRASSPSKTDPSPWSPASTINGRPALEWIIERYQVTKDPNDWAAEHNGGATPIHPQPR